MTRDRKSGIMGAALIATGVVEAVESIVAGGEPLSAVADAVENTRVRGRAIKKASREAGKEIRRRRRR